MAESTQTDNPQITTTFIAFELMKNIQITPVGNDPITNGEVRAEVFAAIYAKVRKAQIDAG